MKTDYTFKKESAAIEAAAYLNNTPGNKGNTVALRDGCRVYIRGEFTSPRLIKILADVASSLED